MNQKAQRPGLGAPGAFEFRIDCRTFQRCEKNTLRGFVSLKITPLGLVVNDVCLHEKQGRRWLSFPAKPYQDKEGKQQWCPIVAIEDKEILRRFQAAGLAAIARYMQHGGG